MFAVPMALPKRVARPLCLRQAGYAVCVYGGVAEMCIKLENPSLGLFTVAPPRILPPLHLDRKGRFAINT